MTIDLAPLADSNRLLFEIALAPSQGTRFQPTGFPDLGAATFDTAQGPHLLVESAQSMANRLESVCWDAAKQDLVAPLAGLSYVRVERGGAFLTSSVLEAHRLNSPYILEGKDKSFLEMLKKEFAALDSGPIDRAALARTLARYDIASLVHGIFLAKSELAGGRLRVARALSSFIEAKGTRSATSGGVKNDHVNPSGDANKGFGNVPFGREEFTADSITMFVDLDLAQLRAYGLGDDVTKLLVLLGLFKVRAFIDGDLRLRTACSFRVLGESVRATRPDGFVLPSLADLRESLPAAIRACATALGGDKAVTTVKYEATK